MHEGKDAFAYLTSIFLATTLVASAVFASPPPVDTLSDGTLAPPHFDYGLDTDGDSLYNHLVVGVNVSITAPGRFTVDATLVDPIGGSTIEMRYNTTVLTSGLQTVLVFFNGIVIRASGIDGPYDVNINLWNDTTFLESGSHTTSAYLHTQFQRAPAEFMPPHLDYGEDTDGDTFFNNLVLEATLNVTQSNQYDIMASLFDGTGMSMIGSTGWSAFLDPGIHVAPLRFFGFLIFSSGFDGPYRAELRLSTSMGDFMDNDTHITQPYLHTDFEPTGGAVLYPPYNDLGVDTDGDALFNYLVIEIPVDVSEVGFYDVSGILYDSSGLNSIARQSNFSSLNPGISTFRLWFVGYEIRNSGFDGPYMLNITLGQMGSPIEYDTYNTGSYLSTDFDPVPAQFAPPHSDFGLDTDGDALFDYLVVNVTLSVSDAGNYYLSGDLYDSMMSAYIMNVGNGSSLATGIQIVQLWFPGFAIRRSGIDGPYSVELALYCGGNFLSSASYLTGSYLHTDFGTAPLYFTPPHSDHGLDTDGDTLFNYLAVEVNVTVNTTGSYDFMGVLSDISGMTRIDYQFNSTMLGVGTRTVGFEFDGTQIRTSGVDGPYRVELTAQQAGITVDEGIHITGLYVSGQFQPPDAQFGSPHSDFGLNTDTPPDGYFDYLVVNATVEVHRAGDYLLEGMLSHPMIPAGLIGVNFTHLDVGTRSVQLRFSGRDIYVSGASGTFDVQLVLLRLSPMGGVMLDMDFYTTGSYLHTDFQPSNLGFLSGYVLEADTGVPIQFADVSVFNFTERSLKTARTDMTGYYSVDLHEGDFFVTADDSSYQAEGALVYVSASTRLNMSLGPVPPNSMSTTLAFSGWDNVNVTSSMSMQQDNQSFRPMVDFLIGNSDGLLNRSEIEAFVALMGNQPNLPGDTLDRFFVDGIHYDLVPGSEGFYANDGGAVWDDAPLMMNMVGDFASNMTIPLGATHLLRINVSYDSSSEESIFRANIPAGFFLQSYDPVPDVNVGGLGTSNIVVDPQVSPGAPLPYVWVNLTVGTVIRLDGT